MPVAYMPRTFKQTMNPLYNQLIGLRQEEWMSKWKQSLFFKISAFDFHSWQWHTPMRAPPSSVERHRWAWFSQNGRSLGYSLQTGTCLVFEPGHPSLEELPLTSCLQNEFGTLQKTIGARGLIDLWSRERALCNLYNSYVRVKPLLCMCFVPGYSGTSDKGPFEKRDDLS